MSDREPTCHPLLAALVDDAGLFPPTELSMAEALGRHERDRQGMHPMLTHRFLVPASRLPELQAAAPSGAALALGLILDTAPTDWTAALRALNDDERLSLAMVDLPVPPVDDPASFAAAALEGLGGELSKIPVFFEPPGPAWFELPESSGAVPGIKVRCGGPRAESFPTPEQLATFMVHCAANQTRFKATAGLHRAARHTDPATGFTHHGFLNVLTAAVRAVAGSDHAGVEAALCVTEAERLAAEIRTVPAAVCVQVRELLVSYGSCSTSEPVEQAAAVGLAGTGP